MPQDNPKSGWTLSGIGMTLLSIGVLMLIFKAAWMIGAGGVLIIGLLLILAGKWFNKGSKPK